jgi:DNA-binding NarL/FixJ family response regulator
LRDDSLAKLHDRLSESEINRAAEEGARMSAVKALAFANGSSKESKTDKDFDEAIGPLTRREWQVARQVAHGLGNRQIAGRLAISPRTVDAHVAHILQKLAFGSRAQVAAWVTDRLRSIEE